MKRLVVLLLCVIFAGCMEFTSSEKSSGLVRHTLFVQCMKLAARIPRQGDGEVANIVSRCNASAYYMSNHIGNSGETQEFLLNQGA